MAQTSINNFHLHDNEIKDLQFLLDEDMVDFETRMLISGLINHNTVKIINKNKMRKSKTVKAKTVKGKVKSRSKTQTRVTDNIYKIENTGNYRFRAMFKGDVISKTFNKLKDAKEFKKIVLG